MSLDKHNRDLLEAAINLVRAVRVDAGWRGDALRAAIKMLGLLKEDMINPPGHNPRSVTHLHETVTPEWLWSREGDDHV